MNMVDTNEDSSIRDTTLNNLYKQLKENDAATYDLFNRQLAAYRRMAEVDSADEDEDEDSDKSLMVGSQDWVDRQIQETIVLHQELREQHEQLRKEINIASRPYVRPLRILDMPDEILAEIFDYVKAYWPHKYLYMDYGRNTKEIKNLRLTCRRFCSNSSHLLLRTLRVNITTSSLAHLEEVSRHPTISKGVQAVRANLYFYDDVMVDDFWTFARYSADKLYDMIEISERMASMEFFKISEETAQRTVQKMKNVLKSWQDFFLDTADEPNHEDDLHSCMLLRRAHMEYGRLYEEQERLLYNGTFVESVGAAISRMPTSKRLEVRDDDWPWQIPTILWEQADDDEAFIHQLVLPLRWEDARIHELGLPPTGLLVDLPIAIHKAGTLLDELDIEVSPPEDYSDLEMANEKYLELEHAAQQLKLFSFRPSSSKSATYWPVRELAEWKALDRFLTGALSSQKLENISVYLESLWERDVPPEYNLGHLLGWQPWQNLFSVDWNGIPTHLHTLEQAFERIGSPLLSHIGSMHLLSGTWAEALDIIRKKSARYQNLRTPSGAEADEWEHEEIAAIFNRDQKKYEDFSKAEAYLRRKTDRNPLRHLELDPINTSI